MSTHDVGDRRRLTITVRDEDGVIADPFGVVFRMREPDDTVTVYVYGTDTEVVKDSPGVYHVDWDITLEGLHFWRFETTGDVMAAEETTFTVRRSAFYPEES
jgi:hypothetical protein